MNRNIGRGNLPGTKMQTVDMVLQNTTVSADVTDAKVEVRLPFIIILIDNIWLKYLLRCLHFDVYASIFSNVLDATPS